MVASMGQEALHPHLVVRAFSGKGRGVIARHAIGEGEVIDRNPVVVVPREQVAAIERTVLDDYVFRWGDDRDSVAVALGAMSLLSHAYRPNANYVRHPERDELWLVALRDIAAGEELTINYGGRPDTRAPVWFEVEPPGDEA